MTRLGLVVPRYGPDVLGGAETFARQLAAHLPAAEFDVTVLTTCARDLRSWHNVFPAGESRLDGVRVLRFPVEWRPTRRIAALLDRINRGEPVGLDDQTTWLEVGQAHSPELYLHLARCGASYDLLLFLPYLFGTTLYGSAVWPAKSVICPCLHDEPTAYFADVRLALRAARGLMFISPAEQALAEKLGVRHPAARLVGLGLDEQLAQHDGDRFRNKFGLTAPFVLYSGRLDPMKNVMQLLTFFLAYRRARPDRPLKLVLAGSGPLHLPAHPDILPVGYLGPQDLHDAYAAAAVLCQPSLVESFSIVLMESWLAGTPVLVHAACPVTLDHVRRSNGGLYFGSAAEFGAALDWLLDHPDERRRMAALGRAYVRREYNWPAVLNRFRQAVALWEYSPCPGVA